MFAKINRGARMAGLLSYLAGPGRHEEHVAPHVVAGSAGAELLAGRGVLDHEAALRLARYLDAPTRATDTTVMRGVYERTVAGRDGAGLRVLERVKVGETDAHVYQIALSVRGEEGVLGDELWGRIARRFAQVMGITSDGGAEGATRWVAIHHGRSANGNDHVHLVVNLAREDGTVVDTGNDFRRAKNACRQVEDEFGLEPLHPNDYELARTTARAAWETARRAETAGPNPLSARIPWLELSDEQQHREIAAQFGDEQQWRAALAGKDTHAGPATTAGQNGQAAGQAAARRRAQAGWAERVASGTEHTPWRALPKEVRDRLTAAAAAAGPDPRAALARVVRGAAAASAGEAEFVRRLRRAGLLVRPRYAAGRTDVITGYSTAARPAERGGRPVWWGGGRLARDLTLPRLRTGWTDTPQTAQAAAAEWTAAARNRRVTCAGRKTAQPDPDLWRQTADRLVALRTRLAAVPLGDSATWTAVARRVAGALAAYSNATEPTPGALAAAADTLAASARTYTPEQPRPAGRGAALGGAAALLATAAGGRHHAGNNAALQLLVLRQIVSLAAAVREAERAAGNAKQARAIAADTRTRLLHAYNDLPGTAVARPADPAATVVTVDPAPAGPVDERAEQARRLAALSAPAPAGRALHRPYNGPAPRARPAGPSREPDRGTER